MSAPKRQGGLRSRSRTDNRAQSASSAAVQLDPQLSDQEESIEQQHQHQQNDILPQQSQHKSDLLSQQQQQPVTLKATSATGGRGGGLRSGARARQNTKSAPAQAAASASQSEVVNDESILFKDDEDNEGEDDDSNGNDDNNANIKARQAASAASNMSVYDAASVSVDAPRIKMMVATDSHLGFLERDPVRGNDSFVSFEEMLQLAVENNVDMVLLGGDLFHENRPSRKTLHRTMEILRKYTMGDRPCNLRHLSDAKRNYGDGVMSVNYMDPNINISLPVFTIHGNHDDPTGDGRLSAVDLLASTRMINYFGQYRSIDDITVAPVLLEKRRGGTEHLINSELTSEDYTRLAIFGLGNVRDERLNRTFLRKRVRVLWPAEDTKSWFNLFVIHQNRAAHGPTSYIPESFLPPLLDMVLWGHEHECRVVPEQNPERLFYVTQPGSSVATALSEGEAVRKHVAI
ncbi:Metallo-dependent phosphatase, partial [Ramicandelaber brevisporus]